MEQLSSHTTSKIWSPSSADVSVESRQAESKLGGVEQVAARLKELSNKALLKGQSHKALQERLKVLKTAWVFGNGEMPQHWCSHQVRKETLITHIHSAIAAFAAVPSVKLPVGLEETIMSEEFDFGICLARFGLDWKKASVMKRLKNQKLEQERVAKLKEQKQKNREARLKEIKKRSEAHSKKQKNRAIKRKKQKLLVLGFTSR